MTRLVARLALVPVVAALVLIGIWVAGGVLTNDFRAAMALTAAWLGLACVAAFMIARRRRELALPVLGSVVTTAVVAGGYLTYTSRVDRVVHERIAVAARPASASRTESRPVNTAIARGRFTSGEHATSGTAALIRLTTGRTVLTIARLDTAPGPDLRVYLVSGNADALGDVVDLGGLKGNKGDQQYRVPATADVDRHRTVVIWCRAFSVPFGSARLRGSLITRRSS